MPILYAIVVACDGPPQGPDDCDATFVRKQYHHDLPLTKVMPEIIAAGWVAYHPSGGVGYLFRCPPHRGPGGRPPRRR